MSQRSITTQILKELVSAHVVIADLTETKPNVMYELGIRQVILRPFVLLAEKGRSYHLNHSPISEQCFTNWTLSKSR